MQKFYLNFLIVILLIVAAFVMFHAYSKIQENKVAANWSRTFGSIEDLQKQYPYRNDNEAANQLKLLAVQLGINFNVYGQERQYTPLNQDADRLKSLDLGYSFWKYFRKQFSRNNESFEPPFPLLAKYLVDYREKLEAVRDDILHSPQILWRQNLNWTEYGPNAAMPAMWGIWEIQRLMSARIIELAAVQDYAEAEKYLEAKWKLAESLKPRCELESQRAAMGMDIGVMDLVRRLPAAQDWIPKFMKHDYQKAYIKALTVEAWFLWRERDEAQITKFSLLNNALDPYLRTGVSSLLENTRKEIQEMAKTNPCDLGYKE